MTWPIPTNFNFLSTAGGGDSEHEVASLEDLSLAPFPLEANGSLYWADTATNWISANANYTQWTFHIRQGLTWSNGTQVNASDIKDWLTPAYALNPDYDFANLHTEVVGVNIVNSDTATVVLNQSDAQLPNRIGTYYYAPMVSPTDVPKGPDAPLFGTGIADGPWYTSNYTSGSTTALLLPNPYWPGSKPTACAIDVTFVENTAQMIPFLVSGQADFAGTLTFGNLAALTSYSNIKLNTVGGDDGTFMMYNVTMYPYNVTQFRQALAYAINTSAIIKQSIFGYGAQANNAEGGIPATEGGYDANQAQYPYDVSKAVSILHSIGFTGGGSPGAPLLFPNGTAYKVTIFSDSTKAWDPSIDSQVASFLTNLGIGVQTQTITAQNLGAFYASNAFNIRNNLAIYTSGGARYFSPWLSAQPDCDVYGTPGCYGWFAQLAPDGQPHEEWPPSADAEYQGNLTAMNNTPATNITGQIYYGNNIQLIRAEYLPVIMLGYPDRIFAYNTANWASWPSYYMSDEGELNESMFNALVPASSVSTSAHTLSTTSTQSSPSVNTVSSVASAGSSVTSTTSIFTSPSLTSSTTRSSLSATTLELIAGIIIVIIVVAGIAVYFMRRRPAA
ncbi:MAG: ABC transporter substrate-binding protein [Nitrososphaerales archaeon]